MSHDASDQPIVMPCPEGNVPEWKGNWSLGPDYKSFWAWTLFCKCGCRKSAVAFSSKESCARSWNRFVHPEASS